MRLQQVVMLGALLVALTLVALTSAEEATGAAKQEVRTKARLPSLFDFAKFKTMFNKHYKSLSEELVRQKIFLGRAFRAFISMVKYRYYQVAFYLSLNPRSDLTAEERRRNMLPVETLTLRDPDIPVLHFDDDNVARKSEGESRKVAADTSSEAVEEIPVANVEEIERQLEEIERNKDQPGFREMAEELEKVRDEALKRQRRSTDGKPAASRRQSLTLDDLMKEKGEELSAEAKEKIKRRVPSNNPDYERPELSSSAGETSEGSWVKPLGDGMVNMLMQLPGAQIVGQAVNSFVSTPMEVDVEPKLAQLPDEVFVDLREDNCMFQPRDQGDCGSCYTFAPVALYEYIFCMETGNLVAFSEQYIIDCGPRLDPSFLGCNGGPVSYATKFSEYYGLELRLDYPYRQSNDTCPYEANVGQHQMGLVKPVEPKYAEVDLDFFETYLEKYHRPIVTNIQVPSDFDDYGGGVHTNVNCHDGTAHSMLIVGHGREDGEEYWLFRNSHSVSWGEGGYYKFSKEAFKVCAPIDAGLVSLSNFGDSNLFINQHANRERIKNRYQKHLSKTVMRNLVQAIF